MATENSIRLENAGASAATGGLPLVARERAFGSRKGFRTTPIMGNHGTACSSKGRFRICQEAT